MLPNPEREKQRADILEVSPGLIEPIRRVVEAARGRLKRDGRSIDGNRRYALVLDDKSGYHLEIIQIGIEGASSQSLEELASGIFIGGYRVDWETETYQSLDEIQFPGSEERVSASSVEHLRAADRQEIENLAEIITRAKPIEGDVSSFWAIYWENTR